MQLIVRHQRRHALDLELDQLRNGEPAPAPSVIESRLPAAPVLLSYGATF
jgi:hypothetical protein